MTPSKTLLYLCISFIIGIALQSIIKIPQAFVWGFLMCGVLVIVISFLRGKHIFVVLGFCVLLFVLGIARLQISEFSISADTLGALRDNPAKITLEGNVISEPDVGASTQKIKVKIEKAESIVLVTTVRYPEFHYLDTVQITGKLKTPPMIEDFNYKNYLQKDGIYSVMDFPVVEVIPQEYSHGAGTFLFSKLLQFKGKLRDSINQNFPPPHSALLEGILLGNTSGMDKETKSKMGAVGLTHLTAISGSNVVILVNILMVFLLFLGLWRGQAFYVSAVFIWLYVAIAAFPASGIRAAVMASVFLLAQKLGRQNTTSRVIILAGALMLLQNPMLLIHDVGFQLSFLASMGIIHGKPIIDYFFRFIENKNARFFVDIFSITMAAQVFTFPIVAYNFKSISLVAPLTNLLVIPVVDGIMIFGLLAAMLGLFSNGLAFVVSIPCWFLLSYFLKVMEIFYQPWAAISMQKLSFVWIPIYYAILTAAVWFLNKKLAPKFLGY